MKAQMTSMVTGKTMNFENEENWTLVERNNSRANVNIRAIAKVDLKKTLLSFITFFEFHYIQIFADWF